MANPITQIEVGGTTYDVKDAGAVRTVNGNAPDESGNLTIEAGAAGADATINGVNALTVQGGDGIEATMSGSTLTIKARHKLMAAADYDAVIDWATILSEGEIAWRCE